MANKRKPAQPQAGSSSSKKKKFSKGPKPKAQPQKQQDVPLPSDDEQESSDVGEEDLQFVQQYGSSLGFLKDLDTQELNKAVKDKQKAAVAKAAAGNDATNDDDDDHDDAEGGSEEGAEEYERRPRAAEQVTKASAYGLPVKTPTGEVVFQPSKKQQLSAAAVRVEGVMVTDTLQTEQQQRKLEQAAAKEAAAAAAAERRAAAAAEAAAAAQAAEAAAKAAKEQGPELPAALLSLMAIQDQQQRREALKQQMALAAQHLLSEPDQHLGPGLRLLLGCAADRDGQVARLALLSLLAVFKDVLPGYRIRSLTEEEQEARVSKEVQALRDFEQALLKGYQHYLKTLLAATTAKPSPGHSPSSILATKRVAVRCMSELLVARPGFNYSSDLLQAVVPMMAGPDVQVQQTACEAVRQLLKDDVQGKTSLEAVQLVADLVKRKKCSAPPVVVSSLLVLRFEQVTPVSAGGEGAGAGKAKKLGKKAARRAKKKSELDKDFEEAEAGPDLAQMAINQSQMLEALFEVFFRVLKHCSNATANHAAGAAAPDTAAPAKPGQAVADSADSSKGVLVQPWPAAKVSRKFPLLQPVLEGLGRYSHLISVEYFNDLMAVLQELLGSAALPVRERLGVLLAALDILKGQGEALTIDRRAFYNHLYQTLLLVPLQILYEGNEQTAAPGAQQKAAAASNDVGEAAAAEDDDASASAEDAQAVQAVHASLYGLEQQQQQSTGSSRDIIPTAVLLLRCLEQQLLGVKQTDMGRLAAYTKRFAQLMLSASVPEALGCACLMYRLMRRYSKLVCQFEWEGGAPVGGRQYDANCPDPSEAGALAAALWELPLLTQHYHPDVAAAAKALLGLTPRSGAAAAAGEAAGNSNSVITAAAGPQDLAEVYGLVQRGGFRPAPMAPAGFRSGRSKGSAVPAGSGRHGMAARQHAAAQPWCEDLQQLLVGAAGQQLDKQQKKQQVKKLHQQEFKELAVQLVEDCDMQAVESAVREQYQLSKQHKRNRELRLELAVAAKKVELFREHLIQKRKQQQEEQEKVRQKKQQKNKQQAEQQPEQQHHRPKKAWRRA